MTIQAFNTARFIFSFFNANNFLRLLGLFLSVALISCSNDTAEPEVVPQPSETILPATRLDPAAEAATISTWSMGNELLQSSLEQVEFLREAIRQLLDSPSTELLDQSRTRWQNAHVEFTQLHSFFGIANTNPGLFGDLNDLHYQIDAQPIQPGFIDYFDAYPFSGIVNDLAVEISAQSLRNQHGITDLSDVSIGFHALEYLLWGENNGGRPASDFEALTVLSDEQAQQGLSIIDLPNNRRRDYVQILAELLIDDIQNLQQQWANNTNGFNALYLSLQPTSRLALWRTVLIEDITAIQFLFATASDTPTDLHNVFAGNEVGVVNAKLTSINLLLFGKETLPDSGLAQWLQTDNVEASDNQRSAIADKLQAQINQLKDSQTWPLADDQAINIQTVLDELANFIRTPTPEIDSIDADEESVEESSSE